MRVLIFIIIISMMICSCSESNQAYIPVKDATVIEKIPQNGLYKVMPGDTLYSIAWRYGLEYHALAKRNNLAAPYSIFTGKMIFLRGQTQTVVASSAYRKKNVSVVQIKSVRKKIVDKEPNVAVSTWEWPAQGPIVGGFSSLNKGLNIGGHYRQPIFSTAAGKVVYSGNGLRGYGNLIIIEHNKTFLTAYAHNSIVYVKSGDFVRARQKIAEMGDSGSRRVMLHFEIRRNGQPVNPLIYLSRGH